MFKQTKTIKLVLLALIIPIILPVVTLAHPTSALSYQDNYNINFTFNPTISVSISGNLSIDKLLPGSYADSNIIEVNVDTNAVSGYTLTATAGTKTGNTTSLVNTSKSTETFTSLATNTTIAELFNLTEDYWGYSYCANNDCATSTNWSAYSGLPLDTNNTTEELGKGGTILLDTTGSNSDPNSIKFKIGAKASNNKASGQYTNTINFYAISKIPPTSISDAYAAANKQQYHGYYTMQDMTSTICNNVELYDEDSQTQLIDVRDSQTYKVAKLKDGKCWMVENLNLAGNTALSADNTDVTSDYISSFSTSNNLTKDGNTIKLPASSTSGFNSDNSSYVYNSGNKENCGASGQKTPCYSYYSWDAATLGSGRNIGTDNTDAPYSICPKGWRLPTSRDTSATDWQTTSDFYKLATSYGMSTGNTGQSTSNFYNQAGPNTTVPKFLLSGDYYNSSFANGGSGGYYWSATSSSSSTDARSLHFYSSGVYSASNDYRRSGFAVRCILKAEQ